jgi:hypothetical protein
LETDEKDMPDSPGPDRKPDAIIFNESLKCGPTMRARINHVLDKLEPHLGGGTGKPGHFREIGGGQYLCTLSPRDKLLFPHGHDLALQPRYDWRDGPDGL